VIIVVAVLACALAVPLAGGRLSALADVRLRCVRTLFVALGLQVLLISVLPADWGPLLHRPLHVLSYLLAAAFFVANRRVPGLWVIGLGGALNFAAITANAGVMPAGQRALEIAGRATAGEHFANSQALVSPRLAVLGDIFAIPASWPFANVFSVGDVLIVIGAALALHRLCGSRFLPPRPRDLARVAARRGAGAAG
jgi:hypothetical protein